MSKILMNQIAVKERPEIRLIQKTARREYRRVWGGPRSRIGKLVRLRPEEVKEQQQGLSPQLSPALPTLEILLNLIERNQMTGMSGNEFPVQKKIEVLMRHKGPKYLLINGVECEPGLLHDEWILANLRDEVTRGIQLLAGAIPFERCVLAHKALRKDRSNRLRMEGIEEQLIPAKYPMGEERILVKHVFHREIPRDGYPAQQGILVVNVQTVVQIYRMVTEQYREGRYVTLADLDSGEARVIFVQKGEKIRSRLREIFSRDADADCFAGSGILSAELVQEDDTFEDQICFAAIGQPAKLSNKTDCKGCGACNRKCPAGVDVRRIVRTLERDSHADLAGLGAEKCISCGSCTFFCHAGKDISEYMDLYRRQHA